MKGSVNTTLTFLTGGRPELAKRTLESLEDFEPGLLEAAHVIVLVNGKDLPTLKALLDFSQYFDAVRYTDEMLPVGPATSLLAEEAKNSGKPFWLHLEDDWLATGDHPDWLIQAQEHLTSSPQVGQVRFRRASEPTRARHMVTERPVRWDKSPAVSERLGAFWTIDDIHWTNNPALMRSEEASVAWPAAGEMEAQRKWWKAGFRNSVQMVPGVFVHIGEGDLSLRKRTGSLV